MLTFTSPQVPVYARAPKTLKKKKMKKTEKDPQDPPRASQNLKKNFFFEKNRKRPPRPLQGTQKLTKKFV